MSIVITPIPSTIELAAPAFTLGTTNTAGAAVTAVASNSTLLSFDTSTPAAVAASAAVGSATVAARRDHVHVGFVASDYSIGTWTPDLSDGSNSASYSTRAGFYTRIGRLCVCTGTFTLSSLGSVSGSARIAGLPFASDSTASDRGVASFTRMLSLNITAGQSVSGYVDNGDSHVSLRLNDADAGDSAMTGAEVSADGSMQFLVTYFTA